MNIIEALKTENVRLSYGNRWLVWVEDEWVVFQHEHRARYASAFYRGESEETAVKMLLDEEKS